MANKSPTVLMILDGWGLRKETHGNAIALAKTPNMDALLKKYPWTKLKASGEVVGLPAGQMGNSEVGHLNMGAGRTVYQDLTRISKTIEDKSFFDQELLISTMQKAVAKNSAVHFMGLLSHGGVHSHIKHLFALLQMAKQQKVQKVYIHAFLDGRDVYPQSAIGDVEQLEAFMREVGIGEIASISGRYYAMDRDNRWDRVEKAYRAIVLHEGEQQTDALQAIEESYKNGKTDEFVQPFCLKTKDDCIMQKDDCAIFFNFRPDRSREITRAVALKDFKEFDRQGQIPETFICMTQYDVTFGLPVVFAPEKIEKTLGEVISDNGLKQLRTAETEKYAHVTFFFNGGVELPNKNEDRVLIPSPQVATYDLEPQMSALEVTDKVLELIDKDLYDVIIMNYANADMVGHSGKLSAAITAVQAVDQCLGKVVQAVLKKGGNICITADHGNAEQMYEEGTEKPYTAHTTNKVPFVLVSEQYRAGHLRTEGILADIAPTMLDILKIAKPEQMTGNSLIEK